MICDHFRSIVDQVLSRLGCLEQNMVMAHYSSDFSITQVEALPCFSDPNVFITWHEYDYLEISGGFEPFLDIICQGFRMFGAGDFSDFLSECGVYVPHQELFCSYFQEGICRRRETVLLDEVKYEQEQLSKAVARMLLALARLRPMLIVLNRFQQAGKSTLAVVQELLRCPSANIGLVLGVNEKPGQDEAYLRSWDDLNESLSSAGHIYHIGNSEAKPSGTGRGAVRSGLDFDSLYRKISNTAELLDYDQAALFFRDTGHGVRLDEGHLTEEQKLRLYPLYAKISILRGDFAAALEVIHLLKRLSLPGQENQITFASEYYLAMCRMYQGKLSKSYRHARKAQEAAQKDGSGELQLQAQMLMLQAQMSGWYNLFFCLKDISIPQAFLDTLREKEYLNFLAHVYVYAFDNDPQTVAGSCSPGGTLARFHMGVQLSEKIGNVHLLYNAHQKNIMIADTYGYYEVAVFYLLKSFRFIKDSHSLEYGRIYSALGYNFSALGKHRIAEGCYWKAIRLFLEKRLPEEIAEVCYNMSLGNMMEKDFPTAERRLLFCIKTVDKLRLNSLRVCNLTKLYGLLALVSILQQDRFGCRRYLDNCGQLLDNSGSETIEIEINHDYARLDDEQFLYWFSAGLLFQAEEDLSKAEECFQKAEAFLEKAKSNQFYAYEIFYEKHMELQLALDHRAQCQKDQLLLEQYQQNQQSTWNRIAAQIPEKSFEPDCCSVEEAQIEALLRQEGMARELRSSRRRMEFLYSWQKLIDTNDLDVRKMVTNAMYSFLNKFGNDCALYLHYGDNGLRVLYNDTGVEVTEALQSALQQAMAEYPNGFAVSKISGNFQRHQDIISFFGAGNVCSFAAVPFFKSGSLESLLVTYVRMKGNWHASMESYMISKSDLAIYQLLFRELGHSVSRIEAYEKICEMNQRLSQAASTDALTGLLNRTGMYQELEKLIGRVKIQQRGISLMFIDMDNFKFHNDTFGHHVGDIILVSMAEVFRDIIGSQGIVSRYGGDEFLIILEESRPEKLEETARAIYARLEAEQRFNRAIFQVLGHPVQIDCAHKITCSIGIAIDSQVGTEAEIHELLKKADDVLYSVKQAQKAPSAFFSPQNVLKAQALIGAQHIFVSGQMKGTPSGMSVGNALMRSARLVKFRSLLNGSFPRYILRFLPFNVPLKCR